MAKSVTLGSAVVRCVCSTAVVAAKVIVAAAAAAAVVAAEASLTAR